MMNCTLIFRNTGANTQRELSHITCSIEMTIERYQAKKQWKRIVHDIKTNVVIFEY